MKWKLGLRSGLKGVGFADIRGLHDMAQSILGSTVGSSICGKLPFHGGLKNWAALVESPFMVGLI